MRMRKSTQPAGFSPFLMPFLMPPIHAGFAILISGRVRSATSRSSSSRTGTNFLILNSIPPTFHRMFH